MKHYGKLIQVIGATALATLAATSAYAQMGGGGMMGGHGSDGGMMGGFGSGSGNGQGMFGGYGRDSRNDNGYGPGTNSGRRDAAPAPDANRSEALGDRDLGPLDQLDLSRQQLGAISIINEELRDRQSNLSRRLAAEQEKLRALYDAPERDRSKIEQEYRRIDQLRREMFESSVNAQDRIEAQLSAPQRQHLHRIAPRSNAGG
ncbi:MAG: Spy/CpxP family protein refolding chaperone [Burkholderiales bacterium]